MPLIDDIKAELQRKQQELEERIKELSDVIRFIGGLVSRLSAVEQLLLESSIDSVRRKRAMEEAQSLRDQIKGKETERDELRDRIQTLDASIKLLEDQTG